MGAAFPSWWVRSRSERVADQLAVVGRGERPEPIGEALPRISLVSGQRVDDTAEGDERVGATGGAGKLRTEGAEVLRLDLGVLEPTESVLQVLERRHQRLHVLRR